jgi:hypothetical protein
MSFLIQYDNLLELECSINYWSDQLLDEAIVILGHFEEND